MDCLKLVPASEVEGDEVLAAVIERNQARSAMLLDPTRCIRCGLCAARCPTEAVRMEAFQFTEEVLFDQVDMETLT
jgi:ferredoxin